LESIKGSKYFTKFDLHSGFNQIRVREEDQPKTAFKCRFGHFEFTVTPFGLMNAPSTFQQLMNTVLHELIGACVLSYIDDILIYSPTLERHQADVERVLQLLQKHKLYIKLKKCEIFQKEVTFLGHKVSENGLSVEEEKTKAINEWPTPTNVDQVHSFVGSVGYYRKFIRNFAEISCPLTHLFKKGVDFHWNEAQEQSFKRLKEALSTAPVLMTPNYKKEFNIASDASANGIGGVVFQLDENNKERPIAFYSRQLIDREKAWSIYERELLALIECLKNFRYFVDGNHVNLFTDHKALIYLNNQPKLTAKQARWISFLNLFNYSIKYREGALNRVADGLSRQHSHDLATTVS